jgi:hypothetical protein
VRWRPGFLILHFSFLIYGVGVKKPARRAQAGARPSAGGMPAGPESFELNGCRAVHGHDLITGAVLIIGDRRGLVLFLGKFPGRKKARGQTVARSGAN